MTRIRGEQPQIAAVNGALCRSWRDGGVVRNLGGRLRPWSSRYSRQRSAETRASRQCGMQRRQLDDLCPFSWSQCADPVVVHARLVVN